MGNGNGNGRPLSKRLTLGRISGIPVHVSPTWFIVAGVITVGLEPLVIRYLPDLGPRAYLVTAAFAVFLYLSVLVHEISHALTARALGLPVKGITLHFLGGYTEIERESPTPGRDLVVAAAGPAASLLIALIAYLVWLPVQADVPGFLLAQLAAANLVVGVFNLLPALPLDGGHMLRAAVWRFSGSENTGTIAAGRAGQVLAGLVLAVPFVLAGGRPDIVSMVWAGLIAVMLWSGASQALAVGRMRARLPSLDTRLLARPAVPVAAELPVSEALKQAGAAQASSLVVVDSAGRPIGIVNETAVAAIPVERRPWVNVGQSSRSIVPGLILRLDLAAEDLLRAMRETPASEYLVVDDEGLVYGVLSTADVDAALAAR